MKTLGTLTLVLLFATVGLGQDAPAKDAKSLQGTWDVVKLVAGGVEQTKDGAQIVFQDDTMTLTLAGQRRALRLVYELVPAGIDFRTAPEPGKVTPPLPGIYQFTEDGLRLCVAQGDPKSLSRPTNFETKKGSTDLLLILKRAKGS